MIEEELLKDYEEREKSTSPLVPILGIFIALLLILSLLPQYAIKLDPSPEKIPHLFEVIPAEFDIPVSFFSNSSPSNYHFFIAPQDPVIKSTADRIIALSGCGNEKICHIKAIFGFVQQRFTYVSDPTAFEYIKTPRAALYAEGGDCDDASVLLANLLEAVGIDTRFVFIPGHVYVQAYFPEALRKYQEKGWINLDATCTYCAVGEIPTQNRKILKHYA